jgi:hypothetical protein
MKKEKLNIELIKVESFVTTLEKKEAQTVVGAGNQSTINTGMLCSLFCTTRL